MPIIKSAKKKLRQDKKRAARNLTIKRGYKEAIKKLKKNQGKENINKVYSIIDKAAKKNIIHKNKASRLKAQISHAVKS